jgi:hypothetical protein
MSPRLLTSLCSLYRFIVVGSYNSRRYACFVESYRCLLNMCLCFCVCVKRCSSINKILISMSNFQTKRVEQQNGEPWKI